MSVATLFGFAEPHSINDRGMVESVTDECVFRAEDSFEKSSIGVKSAGEDDRILKVIKVRNTLLQLFVNILSPTDESNRAKPVAMGIHSSFGCFNQSWMVRESQIIVRAEVQDGFTIGSDLGSLRGADDSFTLVGSLIFHGLYLFDKVVLDKVNS